MLLQIQQTQRPVIVVQPIISIVQLQELLQVDYESVGNDVHLSIADGQAMNPNRQQRAAWLMREPRFQQWFKASGSNILVVDGMETEMNTTSPLTYFCAMLGQNLENLQVAVPLNFFCGMHARPGDSLEGACGIMRSIIYQLLQQRWYFDLSFLDYAFCEHVRSHEITRLCLLFRNLLTSAPSCTIFCVIDGISWFDTGRHSGNVSTMMGYLQDLVKETNRENTGIDFKLLVTSPKACRWGQVWFPTGDRIVMPDETGGDGNPFNEYHMAAQSGFMMGPR